MFRVILAALALSGLAVLGSLHFQKHAPVATSAVLVSDADGHGSGVHIGSGYIVTAAHVTEANPTMTITDSLGHKQTGAVLWSNKTYDIALIRVDDYSDIAPAKLACSPHLGVGSQIRAVGNPLNLENITTWGKIASDIRERGPWKLSTIVDMTIAPGMSGGPVFDRLGQVVGIVVGVSAMNNGMTSALFAIGYIVPSEAVCGLMARA